MAIAVLGFLAHLFGCSGSDETKIQEQVAGHEARNAELRGLISSKGASLEVKRRIDIFFWAPDENSSLALLRKLKQDGVVETEYGPTEETNLWSVQGVVETSVVGMTAPEYTEQLVRLADSCGAKYDGWGTALKDAQP